MNASRVVDRNCARARFRLAAFALFCAGGDAQGRRRAGVGDARGFDFARRRSLANEIRRMCREFLALVTRHHDRHPSPLHVLITQFRRLVTSFRPVASVQAIRTYTTACAAIAPSPQSPETPMSRNIDDTHTLFRPLSLPSSCLPLHLEPRPLVSSHASCKSGTAAPPCNAAPATTPPAHPTT